MQRERERASAPMRSAWSVLSVAVAVTAALAAAFAGQQWRNRCKKLEKKFMDLEAALEVAAQQRSAERTGRIRAQRELRNGLVSKELNICNANTYPLTPIGYVRSCFSTRNGTPRQPLLVPLARACLTLSPGGVPPSALEGLDHYSHCWLLYVFHENTDLPNLWKQPAHHALKAKVRVPRLDGKKVGVFATRSPHRPCPIGLTVGKVEKVVGGKLLLSGVDLVDGTPVIDVKPYLPYSDSIDGASTPTWVKENEDDPLALASITFSEQFSSDLSKCWDAMGKHSLYSSRLELKELVAQVLSRDIRSLSQRQRPHHGIIDTLNSSHVLDHDRVDLAENFEEADVGHKSVPKLISNRTNNFLNLVDYEDQDVGGSIFDKDLVVYHLIIEGINFSYTIDDVGRVLVNGAYISNH